MWDQLEKLFGGWKDWFVNDFLSDLISSVWNLIVDILQYLFQKLIAVLGSFAGYPEPVVVQFTGATAWMSGQLRLDDCLAVILGAVMLKWTIQKIFLKW